MKFFIALVALAAVAVADPDPAVLYSGIGYAGIPSVYSNIYPYSAAYSAGFYNYAPSLYNFGYAAYAPYVQASKGAALTIAKREAEAEADADPALLYSTLGYSGFPAYYSGLSTYATTAYAGPYTYGANYLPYALKYNVAAPAAIPAVFGGYAAAGRYVAESGPVKHIAKRDAEADADPALLYSNLGYAAAYPSFYSGIYNTPAAVLPYAGAYGYTAAYGPNYLYNNWAAGRYFF